jgi:DNA-binding NtrC family response regulator
MKGSERSGRRILVADDEEGVRTFLAIRAAHEEPFDVVVTDLRMPEADGMAVVHVVRTEQPDVEVIVLTAFGDVSTAVEAMKLGAFDYLEKPVSSPTAIRELVANAILRRAKLAASPWTRGRSPTSSARRSSAPWQRSGATDDSPRLASASVYERSTRS